MHCCTAIFDRKSKPLSTIFFSSAGIKSRQRRTTMNLTRSYAQWRSYRNTVSELNGRSNRELDDLGIGRGDIKRIAREATR
jgi:uncharacterized protein YjiS (DUF1127 family)